MTCGVVWVGGHLGAGLVVVDAKSVCGCRHASVRSGSEGAMAGGGGAGCLAERCSLPVRYRVCLVGVAHGQSHLLRLHVFFFLYGTSVLPQDASCACSLMQSRMYAEALVRAVEL